MDLKTLRKDHPKWTWSAKRLGFGWKYIGERQGYETVKVFATAQLSGYSDEFETVWVVVTKTTLDNYATWWNKETSNAYLHG